MKKELAYIYRETQTILQKAAGWPPPALYHNNTLVTLKNKYIT